MIRDGADSKTPVGPDSDKKNQETHPNLEGFDSGEPSDDQPLIEQNQLIVVGSELPDRFQQIRDSTLLMLLVLVTSAYVGVWIWYFLKKEALWQHSQDFIASMSGLKFLETFSDGSDFIYMGYKLAIPLLLHFSPRKDIALRSIAMLVINDVVNEHLRLWVGEGRPFYDAPHSPMLKRCICSYGMPSGHAHGYTMAVVLLWYEISIHFKIGRKTGISMGLIWTFLLCAMMFGRLYFGRHSLLQLVSGVLQPIALFMLVLLFSKPLNKLSLACLNGNQQVVKSWIVASLLLAGTTTLMWFFVYDNKIKHNTIPHKRCDYCWDHDSKVFRKILGTNIMFVWILPGVLIGLHLTGCDWKSCNYGLIKQHFSVRGLIRIVIVAVSSCCLVLRFKMPFTTDIQVMLSIVGHCSLGLVLAFLPIASFNFIGFTFPGDLTTIQ